MPTKISKSQVAAFLVRQRAKRISGAKCDLESALIVLRDYYHVPWTQSCFKNLYYLARLARKTNKT
jgi:hypothetical protein